MRGELRDGAGDFAVAGMAVAIHEEEVFPRAAFAGAALDLRHVEPIFTERRERAVQPAVQGRLDTLAAANDWLQVDTSTLIRF